jgi:hypothetical protein
MPTIIKELPGHKQVATGNNIVVVQYHVSGITPYPNDDLVPQNTYNISDPFHHGIGVELSSPPGGGTRTAIFGQQT